MANPLPWSHVESRVCRRPVEGRVGHAETPTATESRDRSKRMRLDHGVRAGHDRLGLTLVAAVDRMGDLNFLEPRTIG